MRSRRLYRPFTLTLLAFNHDRYPGTEIPRNFSSLVRLRSDDGREDREVLISMNNPLRHDGLAFYQAGFANNDRTTVLQVVRNPSWMLPYVSCALMGLGLLVDFALRLAAFARRRGTRPSTTATIPGTPSPAILAPPPPREALFPRLVLGLAFVAVAWSLRSPAPLSPAGFDIAGFARQPTLVNGRLKPLDTVTRGTLLALQGRQRVRDAEGRTLTPAEWLLDVLYRPERADACQVFEILHPDLLTLLKLEADKGAGGKRFSMRQLLPTLHELDRQARLADEVEAPVRTHFQRAALRLRDNIVLYQRLQSSLVPPGQPDFLERLSALPATLPALLEAREGQRRGRPHDTALAAQAAELGRIFATLESLGHLLPIPPE